MRDERKAVRGRANFDRIKFSPSPFASKMSVITNKPDNKRNKLFYFAK